ncbi:MAG: peptide transporter [Sulfolobales archaeon]|nr:peptide transporter [Sulfolobales archaeon]MCG2893426.1 peptide transporter [Sulfolobales archaeon]MCG2910505.1 peptide transporter [Sulfolobales archaeon]
MSSTARPVRLRIDLKRPLDALVVGALALVSILIRTVSLLNYPRWPITMNEFDPWYLFYNALLIAQAHGNWYAVPPDVLAWFPWGYAIELSNTIGLPFLVALFSLPFYSTYGPDAVYTVAVFSDVLLAAVGVLAAFVAVESITNSRLGGYLAAAFVVVSPALTYKNLLGGLPKTSWGAVFILISTYFLIQALRRDNWILSLVSGVFLFLVEVTWGGYTYVDLSLFVAAFLLVLMNRNDDLTAKHVSIMAVTTAFLTSLAPNNIGFMSGLAHGLALVVISLFLYLDLYLKRIIPSEITESRALIITAILVLIVAAGLAVAPLLGVSPIPSRYYAIINPFFQFTVPIFRTVAEYIPQSAQQMVATFGLPLLLSVAGIYYVLRRNANIASLWLVVLGVASVFGTSEQPYLFNYTAYIVAALAGVAIAEMGKDLKNSGKGRIAGVALVALVGVSMVADASFTVVLSDVPTSITNAGLPFATTNYAWVATLDWIHNNTPQNAFVLSWWDYGYWIQVNANRSVIDENNTLNGTQIRLMAEMFLNNETFAADVLERYFHLYPLGNPNYTAPVYIVAYDTAVLYFPNSSILGAEWFIGIPVNFPGEFYGYTTSDADIAKAMGAMTVIAGYNQTDYINVTLVRETVQPIINVLNSSLAAQLPPREISTYEALLNQIQSASVTAWTPRAYNSLIVSMFVEGLQATGFPVVAPFTVPLPTQNEYALQGYKLSNVYLQYFKPVLIELYPLGQVPAVGGTATVYVVVVVYQFVEPWIVVTPQVVTLNPQR